MYIKTISPSLYNNLPVENIGVIHYKVEYSDYLISTELTKIQTYDNLILIVTEGSNAVLAEYYPGTGELLFIDEVAYGFGEGLGTFPVKVLYVYSFIGIHEHLLEEPLYLTLRSVYNKMYTILLKQSNI